MLTPGLFALLLSVLFLYVFADVDESVKFQFQRAGRLFHQQRFKARSLARNQLVKKLLFASDAALVGMFFSQLKDFVDRFSPACNAFG